MTAFSSGEMEEAMAVSVRVCSCCLWPREEANGRGRCRFCAALRRLQRLQSRYRLRGREMLALVSIIEGTCAFLECALLSNPATLVETAVELLTELTSDEEAVTVSYTHLRAHETSAHL
eukprot:4319557-Alexandrium_andersonii.AAC.1